MKSKWNETNINVTGYICVLTSPNVCNKTGLLNSRLLVKSKQLLLHLWDIFSHHKLWCGVSVCIFVFFYWASV